MTREEAIKVIRKMLAYTDLSNRANLTADMVNACQMAIKALEQEPRWIPVSERLPEIHQDVILSLRSLDIEVGFRAETEPYFYCHGADGCYIEPQNVLAWQPLPEPYNAESEDKE